MRHREVELLYQGHRVSNERGQDPHPGSLAL